MCRVAFVFLAAIFAPSLVLGFLALRTAGEQRGILERQSADLYQRDTDDLAARLRDRVLARQRAFADRVRVLLSAGEPRRVAVNFSRAFPESDGEPFAVQPGGGVVAAAPEASEAFFNNRAPAEIFPTQQNIAANLSGNAALKTAPRKVSPQRNAEPADGNAAASRVVPQLADFQTITASDTDGVLARFNQNQLQLVFWTRPPEAQGYIFGLVLSAALTRDLVKNAFAALAPPGGPACLAVLDENARPVTLSVSGFTADWKHPFVASEIGETLPHWEVALYLREPEQFARSARLVTLTLVLLIALALAAILAGGLFVALDTRRQLDLARKKTDFVSNVSHELKTPLTSIRMFAELLEESRVAEPEKRARYLRIIRLESERLTRLINNVLNFARLERNPRPARPHPVVELRPVLAGLWEAQAARLREIGFACSWETDVAPWRVAADPDAIAQIVVNLLANAEKYANERREITLRTAAIDAAVEIAVLDRGPGVPPGEERRIFRAFHRAHDSLASGIAGSGLGLTLAQRLAREHGGDVTFRRRDGGGSIFTLRLPAAADGKASA